MPIIKANEKGCNTCPPHIYKTITTNNVVKEVIIVILNVSFND